MDNLGYVVCKILYMNDNQKQKNSFIHVDL